MVIYKKSKFYSQDRNENAPSGISPLLYRALRARGAVTPDEIDRFLHPSEKHFHDPFLLNDMDKAVERIRLALETGERICVFGDYDVDGICSTAMLTDYFLSIKANVTYHIPSRSEEGYGMSAAAVEKLYADGVGLIITVDNGISAASEIRRCTELGIDVIVTDHHIPPEELPDCIAVVSHTVPNSRYPNSILCGAGTAFKLLQALAGLNTAMKYVSLAGLASVADVVPLLDENRAFVKLGLEAVNDGNCCIGLTRLLESIPTAKKPYNACNFGFAVAPRLNASGRMKDASLSVELFLSNDIAQIDMMIEELNRLNELRQKDEAGILNDALNMLSGVDLSETRAIVLCKEDWNGGVIGIAASRLLETFHRPTVLFCESGGVLKGSARSMDGINIHDAFSAVSDCFIRFGGHAKAAGVTMEAARLDEFRERLNGYLRENCPDSTFAASKDYEFEIPIDEVSRELINEVSMLAPFGECNPSPVFRSRGVEAMRLRRFGNDCQHTRLDVKCGTGCMEAVWFCSSAFFKGLLNAEKLDILYTPSINKWCGHEGVQLRLKWAQSEPPEDIDLFIKNGDWNFCDALIENSVYRTDEADKTELMPVELPLGSIYKSRLSGIMALAFSAEGAKHALREIAKSGSSVDICFGCPPESPVCDNTLVIAPRVDMLPGSGYNTVVFMDDPPMHGIVDAVAKRTENAALFRIAGAISGESAFYDTALGFSCEREFMADCYRFTMSRLSTGSISFEELSVKLSEHTKSPKYCAKFALRVFVELGFIAFNERDSLDAGSIVPKPLTDSALFSAVQALRQNKFDPSRR